MEADDTTASALLLDRYRVEGILGEGGLGSVVRAFDQRLQRTVAIKSLKRSLAPIEPVATPRHRGSLQPRSDCRVAHGQPPEPRRRL